MEVQIDTFKKDELLMLEVHELIYISGGRDPYAYERQYIRGTRDMIVGLSTGDIPGATRGAQSAADAATYRLESIRVFLRETIFEGGWRDLFTPMRVDVSGR